MKYLNLPFPKDHFLVRISADSEVVTIAFDLLSEARDYAKSIPRCVFRTVLMSFVTLNTETWVEASDCFSDCPLASKCQVSKDHDADVKDLKDKELENETKG